MGGRAGGDRRSGSNSENLDVKPIKRHDLAGGHGTHHHGGRYDQRLNRVLPKGDWAATPGSGQPLCRAGKSQQVH